MKRTLAILALLIVFTATLAALPGVAGAAVTLTKGERAVLAAVNKERTQRGLHALRVNTALTKAARAHVRDMAHHSYFSHTSLNGASTSSRVRAFGYGMAGCTAWRTGEVLARVTNGTAVLDPQQVVAMWMRSPSHRKVLLTPSFRDVGVGIHSADDWRYVALDLGRRVR